MKRLVIVTCVSLLLLTTCSAPTQSPEPFTTFEPPREKTPQLPFPTPTEQARSLYETLKTLAEFMGMKWRSEGNAVLFLTSDSKKNVAFAVDLRQQPYPFPKSTDSAFLTLTQLKDHMGSELRQFGLMCGKTNGKQLRTEIVFWSQDSWEGAKQSFQCGDSGNYEISGSLKQAGSICLVTESAPAKRQDRCINGPRCDDGWVDGTETDVDCGGSCPACGIAKRCKVNSDCRSGNCLQGICHEDSCTDRVQNGNETDVDCGGGSCDPCLNGQRCRTNRDCQSSNCQDGTCQPLPPPPTCDGSPANASARWYEIYAKDPRGCAAPLVAFANSLDAAKQCAEKTGRTPVSQLCTYTFRVCLGNDCWELITGAPSESDARNCSSWYCSNCQHTLVRSCCCLPQPP